ncbi:OmpW/AlkL family protein [Acinetobacter gerneri]|uniref:OmpW family protein n=1 Tax=Acinetobacter gerneri DSM 14967 = CIP 107464 = MTCC 9824 TaxID=1120926 RepID=N8ZRF0_9GAMM|nr:OmpW family outer membrane protein [Acinetobacter gerneri]ENV34040.1 hypothetical protein F960_01730 [Acinetobacter gerneri DSM 14967 = CIP 107464 = MTCC 9824]EPR84138.1 Outer membrane protein W [Acinetobacter gerneri DSM 14967 = CIP 107464 = MTCC 9824]
MNQWLKAALPAAILLSTNLAHAEGDFKRWSVSAGWMHVMPQGKANPFNVNTSVAEGTNAKIGNITRESFLSTLDPNQVRDNNKNQTVYDRAVWLLDNKTFTNLVYDSATGEIKASNTGSAQINGLESWQNAGTGLEADDVDTLGLTLSYYVNDNVSLQLIGGLPPKVDIQGKGEIVANMTGIASPAGNVQSLVNKQLNLIKDIPITNLGNKSKASSVRAWTPAIEAQYQFGKSGVNKFRPYVGVGLMYAHFSNIKLDSQIGADLVAAGHMIQNIHDGQAGAALDGKTSSANPFVRVKTTDAIAPIVSVGATYDINQNWYGIASVSYAKLNNQANIDVIDANNGNKLIHSSTKIDIDPIITYLGVGYRF